MSEHLQTRRPRGGAVRVWVPGILLVAMIASGIWFVSNRRAEDQPQGEFAGQELREIDDAYREIRSNPTQPFDVENNPFRLPSEFEPVLSPSGQVVLTVMHDYFLFDVNTRQGIWGSSPFEYPSGGATFDPSGNSIAVKGGSGQIVLLDARTGRVTRDFGNAEDGEGTNVCFSPCGEFIVDGSWDGKLTVRSVKDGTVVVAHEFEEQMIKAIACLGDYVFVHHAPHDDSNDFIARWKWPLTEGRPEHFTFRPAGLQCFTPVSEASVLISNIEVGAPCQLTLADLSGKQTTLSTKEFGQVDCVQVMPHSRIAFCSGEESVFFVDLGTSTIVEGPPLKSVYGFSFSADGTRVGIGAFEYARVLKTSDILPKELAGARKP